MTYPLSSEVNVGDATEASQYNNLRSDALYLGADPDESGTLRDLVLQQMGTIRLTRVSATTIQLTASENEPAALMIGGKICTVTQNLTILLTAVTLPLKGRYYLYAVATASGSFSLSAGSGAAPAGARTIGTFLWSGTGVIPGTVKDIRTYEMSLTGRDLKKASGRLTLAAGVPVPDTDITVAQTVYFTPYDGDEIGLKIGTDWELFEFAELSASLSGLQHEIPYDVFLYADENGLQLQLDAWGSASARLTAIVYTEGVPVSGADPGLRYLGSLALNASGNCEDNEKARLIWNRNNQVQRSLLSKPLTGLTPAYHQNYWAPYYDNGNAPAVRALIPMTEADLDLEGVGICSYISASDAGYSRGWSLGIGIDMAESSPYTGNTSCVPVFCVSFGNTPHTVRVRNSGPQFLGYHKYTLACWTNYTYYPRGTDFASSCGESAGLCGMIRG